MSTHTKALARGPRHSVTGRHGAGRSKVYDKPDQSDGKWLIKVIKGTIDAALVQCPNCGMVIRYEKLRLDYNQQNKRRRNHYYCMCCLAHFRAFAGVSSAGFEVKRQLKQRKSP